MSENFFVIASREGRKDRAGETIMNVYHQRYASFAEAVVKAREYVVTGPQPKQLYILSAIHVVETLARPVFERDLTQ